MAPSARVDSAAAQVFLPQGLTEIPAPHQSLYLSTGNEMSVRGLLWVERADLLADVSSWILAEQAFAAGTLVCEAGLSQPGDTSLRREAHVLYDGRVYYSTSLRHADLATSTQLLRKCRGWRILGVVLEEGVDPSSFNFTRGLLLCDALGLDTVVTAPFTTIS